MYVVFFRLNAIKRLWAKILISVLFILIIIITYSLSFTPYDSFRLNHLVKDTNSTYVATIDYEGYAIVIEKTEDEVYLPNVFSHLFGLYFSNTESVYYAKFLNSETMNYLNVFQFVLSDDFTFVLISPEILHTCSVLVFNEITYRSGTEKYLSFILTGEIDEDSVLELDGINYTFTPN
jgi:hypothetical protein